MQISKHVVWTAAVLVLVGVLPALGGAITINEIRTNQPGGDSDEYFELAGAPATLLDGLTYLVIGDGAPALGSGVIEAVVNLDGQSIPGDGLFFAAEDDDTFGFMADLETMLNFENNDNVTHMLVSDFIGAVGDDLDFDDNGTLDVTPWSSVLDVIALIEEDNPPAGTEYHYGPPSVGPQSGLVPGYVFRFPDGSGAWDSGPFGLVNSFDTPGFANVPEPSTVGFLGVASIGCFLRKRK